MTEGNEKLIADIINAAELVATSAGNIEDKPKLLVDPTNPHETVLALVKLLAERAQLFDRGVPVRLAPNQIHGGLSVHQLTADSLVMLAHQIARPYARHTGKNNSVEEKDTRLPRSIAVMYKDFTGGWQLPPLRGIAATPLLGSGGAIRSDPGYDAESGIWLDNPPNVAGLVADQPTREAAAKALTLIRGYFETFCFADAPLRKPQEGRSAMVDLDAPPGADESAFLVALLTAVCRPSLDGSPGVLIKAASISGAGTGKGLLARAISYIAFGSEPFAITSGGSEKEFEARIVAELMTGAPMLFCDNMNNVALKSNQLASFITERPARCRVLGKSETRLLDSSALIVLTGNGLSVSEDLARRFLVIELDAKSEDPEGRSFEIDIGSVVRRDRQEILGHLLTIWRWGQQTASLPPGRPLGSFERWCRWVRDPLLALGCQDPAIRVSDAKSRDGRRQQTAEIFEAWRHIHGSMPVLASMLSEEVKRLIDPQARGRQFVSAQLEKLVNTRMHGHVLTRQAPAGKWGAATFALIVSASEA